MLFGKCQTFKLDLMILNFFADICLQVFLMGNVWYSFMHEIYCDFLMIYWA